MTSTEQKPTSFFDEKDVEKEMINVGHGVPFGLTRVNNSKVGIGGAYGTWGASYDNQSMPDFLEERLGQPLPDNEK